MRWIQVPLAKLGKTGRRRYACMCMLCRACAEKGLLSLVLGLVGTHWDVTEAQQGWGLGIVSWESNAEMGS